MLARPFSNCGPTILSQSMNKLMALVMNLFLPDIVQETLVLSPIGLNVKRVSFTPANGRMNSSRMRMWSFGMLSVIVMLPAPTSLLPSQANLAPLPLVAPSNVDLAFGSIFAQGDQASHLWKSFTWLKTAAGVADIVAERDTLNSDGRVAMKMASRARTTTMPRMILRIMIT